MNNAIILPWLKVKGIVVANNATDQQILTEIEKAFAQAANGSSALENERDAWTGEKVTLENERDTLKGQVTSLTNERDSSRTATAAERKGRATATVDLAITQGRLQAAGRDAEITALQNSSDFNKDSAALLARAKIVKTTTDARSGRALANDLPNTDVRKAHLNAVEKHMESTGETNFVAAHNAVKEANPAISSAFDACDAEKGVMK